MQLTGISGSFYMQMTISDVWCVFTLQNSPHPQIKIEEIPFKNKKRHFYTTGHQTLAQFAQTSCGLSFPGDIKILPGHSSDKPAVDDPAFSWDWTR